MKLVPKMFLSLATVGGYLAATNLWGNVAMLESGNLDPMQFQNSDVAYLTSTSGIHFFSSSVPGMAMFLVLVVVLGMIWVAPLLKAKENHNA